MPPRKQPRVEIVEDDEDEDEEESEDDGSMEDLVAQIAGLNVNLVAVHAVMEESNRLQREANALKAVQLQYDVLIEPEHEAAFRKKARSHGGFVDLLSKLAEGIL